MRAFFHAFRIRALVRVAAVAATVAGIAITPATAAPPALTANAAAPVTRLPGFAPAEPPPGSFTVLSYHEVRDETRDYPDPYAVDSGALVAQFAWLRGNGYVPVRLEAIISARQGGKPLPPKAVLLSFDDAYLSFYTRVYPLLRQFGYPAMLAVVGKWIDEPGAQGGQGFGEQGGVKDASFPSWAQIREMSDSGLVEVVSHSYDLHHGILANPQANLEPAATTRLYDAASGGYESDAQWRERVRADLRKNSELIARYTGRPPRAMVWPYGSYNDELVRIAAELGMPVGVTLDDGLNTSQVPLAAMRRLLLIHNPPLADFAGEMVRQQLPRPVRVVEVSLDQVYDADPARQEARLSTLLDRVQGLGATHVFLHAFSDAGAHDAPLQAYFPTRQVAVRGDLFNRAAWQLATRTDVDVYAALPENLLRMPPEAAATLVADLARNSSFEGVYFMPFAAPAPAEASQRLMRIARQWRAPLHLARGVNAAEATQAAVAGLSAGADFVVLNGGGDTPPVAGNLTDANSAGNQPRLLVLLDGAAAATDGARLAERMRALERSGVINFGYREGDFMRDQPPLAVVAPALSVRDTLR